MEGKNHRIVLGLIVIIYSVPTNGRTIRDDPGCPSPQEGIPSCPFPDPELSVLFPHPSDCHWFYHCSNGVAYCKECSSDLHWNVKLETCDYPYRAGCSGNGSSAPETPAPTRVPNTSSKPSDLPTSTPELPLPTKFPQVPTSEPVQECPAGDVPSCPNPDPELSVFFPHSNDCKWFYHCSNGIAYCKICPSGLHWNQLLETCDHPNRAGCAGSGFPPATEDPVSTSPPNGNSTSEPTTSKPITTSDPITANPVPTTANPEPPTNDPNPTTVIHEVTSESTEQCPAGPVPECPEPDPKLSVFIPHPNDCQWYYHCSNGIAYCKMCPGGLHWNVQLETCDQPNQAGCIGNGTPSERPENQTTLAPGTSATNPPSTEGAPTEATTSGSGAETPPGSGGITTSGPSDVCPAGPVPECPDPDPKLSAFFPHPNDCHWYYHCSNGIAYCKVCPGGLHWNVQLETCDYPNKAGCIGNGSPSELPETTIATGTTETNPPSTEVAHTEATTSGSGDITTSGAGAETPPGSGGLSTSGPPDVCPAGPVPECPDPDPKLSVFFPHPNDCQWYYHCSNGIAYCKVCPGGLHWNVQLETCDYPNQAGCIGNGSPSELPETTIATETNPPSTEVAHTEATTSGSGDITTSGSGAETPPGSGGLSTSGPSDVCPAGPVPECPDPDPELSVLLPHPNDCRWYYHCSNGIAYCKVCPAGLHWNVQLETCDFPYRAGCAGGGSPPDPPEIQTTLAPEIPTTRYPTTEGIHTEATTSLSNDATTSGSVNGCPGDNDPLCPFPDPEFSVFFPHPDDCQWFYHCSNGKAYCKICPAGLHWNTRLDACDYPYRAGCDNTNP